MKTQRLQTRRRRGRPLKFSLINKRSSRNCLKEQFLYEGFSADLQVNSGLPGWQTYLVLMQGRTSQPDRLARSQDPPNAATRKWVKKGSPISVSGQAGKRAGAARQPASSFPKSCLGLFRPARSVPVVPFVPVISVLIRMRALPALGEVIRSVTHLVPACHARPGCRAGLPHLSLRRSARRYSSQREEFQCA